jgi:hypothetical protein
MLPHAKLTPADVQAFLNAKTAKHSPRHTGAANTAGLDTFKLSYRSAYRVNPPRPANWRPTIRCRSSSWRAVTRSARCPLRELQRAEGPEPAAAVTTGIVRASGSPSRTS